jgi:hypothetical protein
MVKESVTTFLQACPGESYFGANFSTRPRTLSVST